MLTRIKAMRDSLRPSERKLADFILAAPEEVVPNTMDAIARRVGVSQPTVSRFCRALGFSGYAEFKLKLAQHLAGGVPYVHMDVTPEEKLPGIIGKICDRSIATMMKVRDSLPTERVEQAIEVMTRARRIEFYGAGNTGIIALDIQHKFLRLGIPTAAYSDPHIYTMSASLLDPRDVAVLISISGRTKDIIHCAEVVRTTGATLVAITHSGSPLSRLAAIPIYADVEEDFDIYTPMSSRIAHLAIGDILAVGVALRLGPDIIDKLGRCKHLAKSRKLPLLVTKDAAPR
jgi:RpiR family carbohydrate utilization transcriptional regulator